MAETFRPWGMDLLQMSRESGEQWTGSTQLGDIRVWSTTLTGHYRVRTGLPEGTSLMQFSLGRARTRRIGSLLIGHDDVLAGFAGVELTGVLSPDHHGMSFIVPDNVVFEALAARAPGAEGLIRRTAPYILSRAGSRLAALRTLTNAAVSQNDRRARQLASCDILDALMGILLSAWHRETDAVFHRPTFQRLPIVQRVEELMRSRLGDRLTLHELCAAARASQRSVEYAFSTVYGMGPKQYLKLLRLNAVHQVLRSPWSEAERITQIAHRHGFWHLGHFSSAYRQLFGETPQQTRLRSGAEP